MNLTDELSALLARPPKAERVATIQAAIQFKQLHERVTKYMRSGKKTSTQTQSLISALKEYQ